MRHEYDSSITLQCIFIGNKKFAKTVGFSLSVVILKVSKDPSEKRNETSDAGVAL